MRSPFELQSFIDWLEKHPADEEYTYASIHDCLNCRYLRSVGFTVSNVGGTSWIDGDLNWHELPGFMLSVPLQRPWTFGAALERAKALNMAHSNFESTIPDPAKTD